MALPVQHKSAVPGWYGRYTGRLGYTYVGDDNFSDHPTVEDVYNLFVDALFGGSQILQKPDVAIIISGEFAWAYPGHDPEEEVTTLSYGENAMRAWTSIQAHYEENPDRSAAAWLNDYLKNYSTRFGTHEWFNVYRVSVVD